MKFEPDHIEVFAGGEFELELEPPKTVGELRAELQQIDDELAGWDDDAEVTEVWLRGRTISVTLAQGIPQ